MKLVVVFLFATISLVAADVAHLGRTYLPPARLMAASPGYQNNFRAEKTFSGGSGFSEKFVQAAPAANYISPSFASFSSSNSRLTNSAPARIVSASQNFISPATFTARKFTSAQYNQPSRQYLSPEVETFEPIVQQSYSAPIITYSSPVMAVASGIETKYSADGGYVY